MTNRLEIIEENGKVFWKICKMPGGMCSLFKGHNYGVCKNCGYSGNQKASKDEINEYYVDEELSKIIMAGAAVGVKHWLFCTHLEGDLNTWCGCRAETGCCSELYWSRDPNDCLGCEHRRRVVLNHKGFDVGLDTNGQITIKKVL